MDLTPDQAATILRADGQSKAARTKALLQKVVAGTPLSTAERSALEHDAAQQGERTLARQAAQEAPPDLPRPARARENPRPAGTPPDHASPTSATGAAADTSWLGRHGRNQADPRNTPAQPILASPAQQGHSHPHHHENATQRQQDGSAAPAGPAPTPAPGDSRTPPDLAAPASPGINLEIPGKGRPALGEPERSPLTPGTHQAGPTEQEHAPGTTTAAPGSAGDEGNAPETAGAGQGKPLPMGQGETPSPGGEGDWLAPDAEAEARGAEGLAAEEARELTGEASVWEPNQRSLETRSTSDFNRAARRKLVLELRCQWPPLSIRQIAEHLGISRNVVWDDIQALKAMHAELLDGRDTAEILGRTLDQWDIICGKAMKLAETYSSPLAKAAMLRVASRSLEMKTKLMVDTGMLEGLPEQLKNLKTMPGLPGGRDEPKRGLSVRDKIALMTTQLKIQNGPEVEATIEPPTPRKAK